MYMYIHVHVVMYLYVHSINMYVPCSDTYVPFCPILSRWVGFQMMTLNGQLSICSRRNENLSLQLESYRWTVVPSIKADGEETHQSSYNTNLKLEIVCESR